MTQNVAAVELQTFVDVERGNDGKFRIYLRGVDITSALHIGQIDDLTAEAQRVLDSNDPPEPVSFTKSKLDEYLRYCDAAKIRCEIPMDFEHYLNEQV